jgi:hypothetical protein
MYRFLRSKVRSCAKRSSTNAGILPVRGAKRVKRSSNSLDKARLEKVAEEAVRLQVPDEFRVEFTRLRSHPTTEIVDADTAYDECDRFGMFGPSVRLSYVMARRSSIGESVDESWMDEKIGDKGVIDSDNSDNDDSDMEDAVEV